LTTLHTGSWFLRVEGPLFVASCGIILSFVLGVAFRRLKGPGASTSWRPFELPKCAFWHPWDSLDHNCDIRFDFFRRVAAREGKKHECVILQPFHVLALFWRSEGGLGCPWGGLGELLGGLKGLSGRLGNAPRPQSRHNGQKGCVRPRPWGIIWRPLGTLGDIF